MDFYSTALKIKVISTIFLEYGKDDSYDIYEMSLFVKYIIIALLFKGNIVG